MSKLKQRRKSRYRRAENEIPQDRLSLIGQLSYPREYIERDGKYMLTEKAFQKLMTLEPEAVEAAEAQPDDAGAALVPESEAAPVSPPVENPPPEARFGTVPTSGSPEERRLKVLHKLPNPTMLIAVSDAHPGIKHHVQVGNSANFVPGMPLNAVPHPQSPAFWRAVLGEGNGPRWNGRW